MRRSVLFLFLLACTAGLFAVSPSGTLPVMYITTKNKQDVSRETPVEATMYVTAYGDYRQLDMDRVRQEALQNRFCTRTGTKTPWHAQEQALGIDGWSR